MKIHEVDMQMQTPAPTPQKPTPPTGGGQQNQAPETNKGVDPAMQAKAEAERKATMSQQRSAIQAQIKSLDDQKKALMAQLASMK